MAIHLIKNNICRHFSPHVSFSTQGSVWGEYVLMDVLAHRIMWEQTTSKSTVHTLGPSVPTKQERNQKKRRKKKSKKDKCTSQKNIMYCTGQNIPLEI